MDWLWLSCHAMSVMVVFKCRLCKETATPMVLELLFCNMNYVILYLNLWQIAPKRYNTYSVVPHTQYLTPG